MDSFWLTREQVNLDFIELFEIHFMQMKNIEMKSLQLTGMVEIFVFLLLSFSFNWQRFYSAIITWTFSLFIIMDFLMFFFWFCNLIFSLMHNNKIAKFSTNESSRMSDFEHEYDWQWKWNSK